MAGASVIEQSAALLKTVPATMPCGSTVTVKRTGVARVPSLTHSSMSALPLCPAAGVMVTVRLAPLPLRTMLAFGTRVMFEDAPVTVSAEAAVASSATVKASAPVEAPADRIWFSMPLTVGAKRRVVLSASALVGARVRPSKSERCSIRERARPDLEST